MEELIRQERLEEANCLWVRLRDPPPEVIPVLHGQFSGHTHVCPVGGGKPPLPTSPPLAFRFKRQTPTQPRDPVDETRHEVKESERFSPRIGTKHHFSDTEVQEEYSDDVQTLDSASSEGNVIDNEGLATYPAPPPNGTTPD